MIDKNCLSHWFPPIEAAGLPVPRTRIVRTELDLTLLAEHGLMRGSPRGTGVSDFLGELGEAAKAIGYPVFLRTGHGSAKHEWVNTCCVAAGGHLGDHVHNLVEWSCMAGVVGLPTNVWAVREMLPTSPVFTAFRGMPICREFRVFVDGPEVICVHPYWPREALVRGFPMRKSGWDDDGVRNFPDNFHRLYERMCVLSESDRTEISSMASIAGNTLSGKWSVDLIETERGWYLTDMAEAHRSFHWEGCPEAERLEV